jgi:hypothetical protein
MDTTDRELLKSMDAKLATIRTRTTGVALGFATGFYLWGEGGTSKTYTVTKTLEGLKKPFTVTSGRLTGRGLFDLLDTAPDRIHVLDDLETLFDDKTAHGVLRAALWGEGNEARSVVWQTGTKGRQEVVFTGGIILIANRPLDGVPALRALKTRLAPARYLPTTEEVAALMRDIASKGFPHGPYELPPAACLEVAEAILQRSAKLNRNLDLRLLVSTMRDRLQYEAGLAEVHWLDLLDGRLQERVVSPTRPLTKAEKVAKEVEYARSIAHLPREERVRQWEAQTGMSQATLYRRLGGDSQDSHFLN